MITVFKYLHTLEPETLTGQIVCGIKRRRALSGGVDRAEAFMDALRLPISAPSFGGVESLVTRPAATSHRSVPRSDRLEMGIKDQLVRLSIGIENTGDLIGDVARALDAVRD